MHSRTLSLLKVLRIWQAYAEGNVANFTLKDKTAWNVKMLMTRSFSKCYQAIPKRHLSKSYIILHIITGKSKFLQEGTLQDFSWFLLTLGTGTLTLMDR